jgi:hypothetical protein
MKSMSCTKRPAACSRILILGVSFLIPILWLGSGSFAPVLAQGGAQAQPGAAAPTPAPQANSSAPYLLGHWMAFGVALGFAVLVLLLTVLVKSKEGVNFFQSPDGAVSVSKVQVWLWTMTIIFSYVYLFLWHGPPDKFPDSLWELMGISALSTGTARYIAVVTGKPQQPAANVQQAIAQQRWLASMLSDDGQPSMMRLQMFGWTLVTVFLFLMELHRHQALWDVPIQLVILMGISHAGYLADKGVAAAK